MGYASEEVTRVPVLAEQISVAPEIILEPTITVADQKGMGSIQGVAILEGEIDHGGITVAIEGSSLMAMTDVNGNYEISNVPEGTYTLLTKGDYRTRMFAGFRDCTQPAMVQMVIWKRCGTALCGGYLSAMAHAGFRSSMDLWISGAVQRADGW